MLTYKQNAFHHKQGFRLTNLAAWCFCHYRCLQVNRASLVSFQKGESCVSMRSHPVCLLCSLCPSKMLSSVYILVLRLLQWIPCGQCCGCRNSVDCNNCVNCKHGVTNSKTRKRICYYRKCLYPIRKVS